MLLNKLESLIFARRWLTAMVLAIITLFLGYQASHLRIDAAFEKQLPADSPFMVTFFKHQLNFGGANRVLIAIAPKQGDIFTKDFMATLKSATDDVFFIPGVDRARVSSLFTPDVRFIEVDEQGFAGGNVIPADFAGSGEDLARVRENILKSGQLGRLVANDFSAAMISAQLIEQDPTSGARLDYIKVGQALENLRAKYPDVNIHIIGFAKVVGDIADGVKGVAMFFGVSMLVTLLLLLRYTGSLKLSLVLFSVAVITVICQSGLMVLLGYGIDPMSILLPFLIFAIAVSHGVQILNAFGQEISKPGATSESAARASFRRIAGPGSTALMTEVVGFITLVFINIPIIRELAVAASVGVLVAMVTDLVMLPLWISYVQVSPKSLDKHNTRLDRVNPVWQFLSHIATPKVARLVIASAIGIGLMGWAEGQNVVIGDTAGGVPELRQDSQYNKDDAYITSHFSIGTDVLTIIAETAPNACVEPDVMSYLDRFDWHMRNVPGVQSTLSLPQMMKVVASGWNEGNLKWRALPTELGATADEQARNRSLLTQASRPIESSTGLLNADCSVMPIMMFLTDHKSETIDLIIHNVEQWIAANPFPAREGVDVNLRMATGSAGVMAATNEAVRAAHWPMLLSVYGAVATLCFIMFRSLKAVICCVAPLVLVTVLANALMAELNIGLKVATLPVAALGVGAGIDFAIYIFSRLQIHLSRGLTMHEAWARSLRESGNAELFTGLTLAAGVSMWIFSALKFQADMGIMLTFMFLVNMLGAILLVPALAAVLIRPSAQSPGQTHPDQSAAPPAH